MSVFSSIMSKIFGHGGASGAGASAPAAPTSAATGADPGAAPFAASGAGGPEANQNDIFAVPQGTPTPGPGTSPPAASASPQQGVDVEAVLTGMAAKAGQTLDWRHSIVDLMKLLGLDSGLDNRKQLAHELGYTGDTSDSASMNVWLHRQVMQKLAQNGGKVPADLMS